MASFFQYYELIERSGLFDPAFYNRANPEVAAANIDPLTHYLELGASQGRNPSEYFDAAYYVAECRRLGVNPDNPLVHFILDGSVRGLKPRAAPTQGIAGAAKNGHRGGLIDGNGSNHDVEAWSNRANQFDEQARKYVEQAFSSAFVDDMLVQEGLGASKKSSAAAELYARLPVRARPSVSHLFDREFYFQVYPEVAQPGIDPLLHFITHGCAEGRSPSPFVDIQYIKSFDPTLLSSASMAQDLWDVLHYNLADPSPYFSIDYYGAQLPDAPDLTIGYLEHFLSVGCTRGLRPNPLFDPIWYCRQLEGVFDVHAAMRHFILAGDREGRAPSPEFSSRRYLWRHSDVVDARVPPLAHYLTYGRKEGRSYFPEPSSSRQSPALDAPGGLTPDDRDFDDAVAIYQSMRHRIDASRQQRKDDVEAKPLALVRIQDPIRACAELSFARRRVPKVSILIPVYNEAAMTAECLASIASARCVASYEVILADDASTEPAIKKLGAIKNVIFISQPANLGFLQNCNAAFHQCRGDYVLLLNNDAQLMAGALDALVAVLDGEPDIAAVGPKILYPNGRLQEAGCAIDRNGITTMVGLFADPRSPEFTFARDVHYCSGAALMIRRSEIGDTLFDTEFAPAYCEDADLCLRFLSKKRRVRYCPDAVVAHHLSVSTNKQSETKRLQLVARNQSKLANKWLLLLEELNSARVICFYLPQFHATAENDFNWGQGFTEWTNVTKAKPAYENHYQPHLPADLGFYDLRLKQTIEQQVALARRYGIGGFCVYYYNFGEQRALDRAFEAIVADKSIDFPFFVCWANENWTRHWDGGAKHVIFKQEYDCETLEKIIRDTVRYAADTRYLRVNGKPMFAVYRPMLLPDAVGFAALCRTCFREAGFDGCHLVFVESMETAANAISPGDLGFDACIEFPPHGNAIETTKPPSPIRVDFSGAVYDYEATVDNCLGRRSRVGKRYPAVFPGWDNTPRQPKGGDSFVRVTPEAFQVYVEEKLEEMQQMFVGDERLLFVNAWNEWAEGAHLEPDQRFGHRWLEAVRNALLTKSLL